MSPDEWFGQLTAAMAQATEAHNTAQTTGADDSTESVNAMLLELARIAAHGSERWTAPVTTYRLGLALAAVPEPQRRDVLEQLVAVLAPLAGDVA